MLAPPPRRPAPAPPRVGGMRRPAPVRLPRAPSARPPPPRIGLAPAAHAAPAGDAASFDAALTLLLSVSPAAVPATARAAAPAALTLPFMLWLADQEDGAAAADDAARAAALAAVGAALTAAREGLDEGAPPLPPFLPAPATDEDAIEAAVAARWRALGAVRGGGPTSLVPPALAPAALAAGNSAAAALAGHLTTHKAAQAAALMGRVRLDADAAAAAVAGAAAGDAAARILGLLLDEPDREARLALLPDAFDAGEGGGRGGQAAPNDDPDTEQVWTTPLRLVAAIDLALARLADAASAEGGGRAPLPSLALGGRCPAAPGGGDELTRVLGELRAAALEYVGEEEE